MNLNPSTATLAMLLLVIVLMFFLSGCARTPVTGLHIHLTDDLSTPCETPVSLPGRSLTQRQVEELWEHDRGSLLECAEKVQGLKDIIGSL